MPALASGDVAKPVSAACLVAANKITDTRSIKTRKHDRKDGDFRRLGDGHRPATPGGGLHCLALSGNVCDVGDSWTSISCPAGFLPAHGRRTEEKGGCRV